MRIPIVNLGGVWNPLPRPRRNSLGEKTLLEQACDLVYYFQMFPGDDSQSMAAKQEAIDAMKGLLSNLDKEDWNNARDSIKSHCNPPGEDIFEYIQFPLPENPLPPPPPPTNPNTPSTDKPKPPPPLGPSAVATGYKPPEPEFPTGSEGPFPTGSEPEPEPFTVSSREENPPPPEPEPFTVSSREENPPPPEPEPFTVSSREENPPPPPPPPPYQPYQPPPPVPTPSVGCWYVQGQGYSWGPRPSGGESTGLNQNDCEAIRQRDLAVRGITAQNVQPSVPGGLFNNAMNLAPSGGAGMVTPASIDNLLGRRSFPVVNL